MTFGRLKVLGALLLGTLLLTACPGTETPPDTGSVSGYIANRKAGTAVEGTTVSVVGTDITTTTDASGAYTLEDVPTGEVTLTFDQEGYAQTKVEGLRVAKDLTTRYDTIQNEAWDPVLPTVAPDVTLDIESGDAVMAQSEIVDYDITVNGTDYAEGDTVDEVFKLNFSAITEQPDINMVYDIVVAGLGQVRGLSSIWNSFEPGTRYTGYQGGSQELIVSGAGFDGETTLHLVVHDQNLNRTEVVRYVTVSGALSGVAPEAPELIGLAVTFGDVAYSSVPFAKDAFDSRAFFEAVKAGDAEKLSVQAAQLKAASEARSDLRTQQDALDEVITWVDLFIGYEGDAPTAFEIYRQLGDGELLLLNRIDPESSQQFDGDGNLIGYTYRDASPALRAGVETTYRVDAVTGDDSASSETFSVAPLEPFYVRATSPEDGAIDVSVTPDYEMTFENRDAILYIGFILLDRVQADTFLEFLGFPSVNNDPNFTEVAIPHPNTGLPPLQPYHAYDWQPVAITSNGEFNEDETAIINETAISIGADFFDLFGSGFTSSTDGDINTFLTGDGSF